jgi:hypothetical protein
MNDTVENNEELAATQALTEVLGPSIVPGDGEAAHAEGTVFVAEDNEAVSVSYDA